MTCRCRVTPGGVGDIQRQAKGCAEVLFAQDLRDGPLGNHGTVAQQQRMGEPRRDLFEVVRDQNSTGSHGVRGQLTESLDQTFTPGQVKTRARLIQEKQLGITHQCTGDLHTLAFAVAQGSERAVEERGHAPLLQQAEGAAFVVALVSLTPAAGDTVRSGDNDVQNFFVLWDLVGKARRCDADARAQFEDVNCPEDLIEDPGNTTRGMHAGARNLQEGALTGAVRPQDYPAFAFSDAPIDVIQQCFGAADHADTGQSQNFTHNY
jgi:hypothetical protein